MAARLLFVIGIAAAFLVLTPASASAHCHEPTAYQTVHAAVEAPAEGPSGTCGRDSRWGAVIVSTGAGLGAAVYAALARSSARPFRRFKNLDPPTYAETKSQPWRRPMWIRDNTEDATKLGDVVAKAAPEAVATGRSDSRAWTSIARHTQGQTLEAVQANNPMPLLFEAQAPPDPLLGGTLALTVTVVGWLRSGRPIAGFFFRANPMPPPTSPPPPPSPTPLDKP